MEALVRIMLWVWRIGQSIFTCNHARVTLAEGKSICPDCGHGVIVRWAVLRCRECNIRREGRYLFRSLMPLDNYCTRCGEHETVTEYLENPEYFVLMNKAILMVQSEEDYLQSMKGTLLERTRVWFEAAETVTIRGLLAPVS